MKRITPEQVLRAYQKTGIFRRTNVYSTTNKQNKPCGCPLTALFCAVKPSNLKGVINYLRDKCEENCIDGGEIADWAEETYGHNYKLAFVTGVDGRTNYCNDEESVMGYEDGVRVRKTLRMK